MAIAAVAAKATSSRVAEMTDPAIRYKTSQAAAEPPARAQRLRLRGGKGARAAFLLSVPLSWVIELPPFAVGQWVTSVNRGCGRTGRQSTKTGQLPDFWNLRAAPIIAA